MLTSEKSTDDTIIEDESTEAISRTSQVLRPVKKMLVYLFPALGGLVALLGLSFQELLFQDYLWKNEVSMLGVLVYVLGVFFFYYLLWLNREIELGRRSVDQDWLKALVLLAILGAFIGNVLIVGNVFVEVLYYYLIFILGIYILIVTIIYPDYYSRLIKSLENLPYVEMKGDIIKFATDFQIYVGGLILVAGIIMMLAIYSKLKGDPITKMSKNPQVLKLTNWFMYSRPPVTNILMMFVGLAVFFLFGTLFSESVALPLLILSLGIIFELIFSAYDFLSQLRYRAQDESMFRFLSQRQSRHVSVGSFLVGIGLGLFVLVQTGDQGLATLWLIIGIFIVPILKVLLTFLIHLSDPKVAKYAIRRFLGIIPLFVGASILLYTILLIAGNPVDLIVSQLPPGSSRQQIKEIYENLFGFDQPPPVQWANYFFHFLLGDRGVSIASQANINNVLGERLFPTLELALIPLILAVLLSLPLGSVAAKKQYSFIDNIISIFSVVGLSIPVFFFLILLVGIFSVQLLLLPTTGAESSILSDQLFYVKIWIDFFGVPDRESDVVWRVYDHVMHLLIPVAALTLLQLALYVRLVRSGMLEELRKDYVLAGRASGFSEQIVTRRAIKNVLVPLATFIGLSIGASLGGAPITETVMAWPGLGIYTVQSIGSLDYPPVMATSQLIALMIMFSNLITDIVYSILDPRIRLE